MTKENDKKYVTEEFVDNELSKDDNIMALSVLQHKDTSIDMKFRTKNNDETTYLSLAVVMSKILNDKDKMKIFLDELYQENQYFSQYYKKRNISKDTSFETTEEFISSVNEELTKELGIDNAIIIVSNAKSEDIENPEKAIPVISSVSGEPSVLAYSMNKVEDILSGNSILLNQSDAFVPETEEQRQFMEIFNEKLEQLNHYKETKLKELKNDKDE